MCSCGDGQTDLVTTEWGEVCLACALAAGLSEDRPRIANYERFDLLGEGSMGAPTRVACCTVI